MGRDVVCISHTSGAGGEEVGRLVADRLGYLYADEEIISRAAERGGIDSETVADQERRKSVFENLMEAMAHGGSATGVPPMLLDEVPSEAVRAFIREAIHDVAEHGNAVIVAHAASYAVDLGSRQLRVFVTAPRDTRAKRVASAEGTDEQEAVRLLKRSDSGRSDYLKRFYGVGEELPIHYDLVINTETLTVEQAAELVLQAAGDAAPSA